MSVSISDIKSAPGLAKELHLSLEGPFEGLQTDGPVSADLEIMSGSDGTVSVRGSVKARVILMCSRCACDYPELLEVSVDELFVPEADLQEKEEREVGVEELCVFGYSGDELQIEDLVRDNLIAGLPYRPLCKVDCLGVCPECGQNLNEKMCSCRSAEEEADPRWGALKKFSVEPS